MGDHPFTFEETDIVFGASKAPLIKVQPVGLTVPEPYRDDIPKIYNLEVRPDDIWTIGIPKCGNTWLTELIWYVAHDGDLDAGKTKYPLQKWIGAELEAVHRTTNWGLDEKQLADVTAKSPDYLATNGIETLINADSPRYIRTHLPLAVLPPKLLDTCKVVYICRNFKDMFISMFNMFKGGKFESHGSLEDYAEEYFNDREFYCPIWQHVREAWGKRHHKNMYFIFYEDMKKDLPGVVRKMAKFLDKKLTDEQVEAIADRLSIKSMRENKYTNMLDLRKVGWLSENANFIRKGVAGEWKTVFSQQLLDKYNAWWQEHMGDSDFKFPDDF